MSWLLRLLGVRRCDWRSKVWGSRCVLRQDHDMTEGHLVWTKTGLWSVY